jgi:hypothetical protein
VIEGARQPWIGAGGLECAILILFGHSCFFFAWPTAESALCMLCCVNSDMRSIEDFMNSSRSEHPTSKNTPSKLLMSFQRLRKPEGKIFGFKLIRHDIPHYIGSSPENITVTSAVHAIRDREFVTLLIS